MFRELNAQRVIETAERLRDRIRERFPAASLGRVADELVALSRDHATRSVAIGRPHVLLRTVCALLVLLAFASVAMLLASARRQVETWTLSDTVQTMESGISMLFFLGAGAVFTFSIELRGRRRRCLEALHELRAMAHIVDMHQLTKDPDRVLHPMADTASSPERKLNRFELNRYLDYCSEMLSLMGKLAALYGQKFPDPTAVQAVDEIEDLTTSLSRKIWQKIMILEQRPATDARP